MTENDAIEMLRQLNSTDAESAHLLADDILCKFIIELGYPKLVEAWEAIQPKWYA